MRWSTTLCPECEGKIEYQSAAVTASLLRKVVCPRCKHKFDPRKQKGGKGKSDDLKRSQKQEKSAAKRYGGTRTAGSGSSWREKGDFKERGVHRGECKLTRAKSYSLKLDHLLKVEKEAEGDEVPLLEIQFDGVHPPRRYVVLRSLDYEALRGDT